MFGVRVCAEEDVGCLAFMILCFVPFRQGLSLNLELDWRTVSLSDPPISVFHPLTFMWLLGTKIQFPKQALLPLRLSHCPSPDLTSSKRTQCSAVKYIHIVIKQNLFIFKPDTHTLRNFCWIPANHCSPISAVNLNGLHTSSNWNNYSMSFFSDRPFFKLNIPSWKFMF